MSFLFFEFISIFKIYKNKYLNIDFLIYQWYIYYILNIGENKMQTNYKFDFYSPMNFSNYSLNQSMRYQLSLLDNLDHLTKRHSENVANLTCRICEYLGCKKHFILYATMCAYLHDIGKIFIPHDILFKDGKLTDEEYELMKKHTVFGYNLCMNDEKLKMFAEGALYHHECLDGSGYPNGVSGNEIPYASQIIHVADVYDALVTKRHYTTHVNISTTLQDLIKESVPSSQVLALDSLSTANSGKVNKKVLNALFKVVIDDTLYEIASTKEYISHLKDGLSRLIQIAEFDIQRNKQKSEKGKEYYENGMKALFTHNENMDNYMSVLEDHKNAIDAKNQLINDLYNEVKILKKLKC